jgi:hypothetical protein
MFLLEGFPREYYYFCSYARGFESKQIHVPFLPRVNNESQSQIQSQTYFTTGGLPPISSSWRQAPWDSRPAILFSNWTLADVVLMGPRQRSHSRLRVPRDSWPHFTISDSRLLQFGGPGPCIYIPQEHVGPVISPRTGLSFRRLLPPAGLRWRYPNPPPRGSNNENVNFFCFIIAIISGTCYTILWSGNNKYFREMQYKYFFTE